MMRRILPKRSFNRPTLRVARELLGKYLVRKIGAREIVQKITEVEAYVGFRDKASHASRGMTARNRVMFGPPGVWYVYFTYGMHWMLNIVTEREGYPAAILIRGVEDASGPGRVTKFFRIDRRFNGKPTSRRSGLWIEDRGVKISPRAIHRSKRIGVNGAGPWAAKLWRFHLCPVVQLRMAASGQKSLPVSTDFSAKFLGTHRRNHQKLYYRV